MSCIDETFEKVDFNKHKLEVTTYENVVFRNCDFQQVHLGAAKFIDCEFLNCNLSLAKPGNTSFREVQFKECKMLGMLFQHCNPFGFQTTFTDCNLDHSSFYQVKLKKTVFTRCRLHDTDFTDSDLQAAVFDDCDLLHAKFENTNLEKADFSSAFNYLIDPQMNRMKLARFSINGLPGLLQQFDLVITS